MFKSRANQVPANATTADDAVDLAPSFASDDPHEELIAQPPTTASEAPVFPSLEQFGIGQLDKPQPLWIKYKTPLFVVLGVLVLLVPTAAIVSSRSLASVVDQSDATIPTFVAGAQDPDGTQPSVATDCLAGVTAVAGNVLSFCGPARANVTVGRDTLDVAGGMCQRGDGWFTANVGVYSSDASVTTGGFVTVSAGVFPPDLNPPQSTTQPASTTTTTTTTVPPIVVQPNTTVLIPNIANTAPTTSTTIVLPVVGDGTYAGQALIVVRIGDVSTVVDQPRLDFANGQKSLTFSGVSFETGEAVSGAVACA